MSYTSRLVNVQDGDSGKCRRTKEKDEGSMHSD